MLLLSIIALAFILRVWNINTNPPGVHADEADSGYTALSLIKTLHDPYGNFLPLQFQGQANNYRAPLYTYIIVPFVYFFGLSPFTTRIPSALFGVLFVILLYIVSLKLFGKKDVALCISFLAAINPWSILISRTGLEVNLCVVIVMAAITAFLYKDKHISYIPLSTFLFGLALFSYHPAKIAVPLILFTLFLLFYKDLLKKKMILILSASIFSIFLALIFILALYGNGAKELYNVSIFDSSRANEVVNSQRTQTNGSLKLSPIFSNKPIYYAREFINHYIAPLSLNYLYVNGESNLDKGLGNYGQYHFFEIPLVLLGLIAVFKRYRRIFYLLIAWFAIGLIPGGITKTGYYSYRDVILLPVPLILGGLGISYFQSLYRRRLLFVFSIFTLISAYLFCYFLYNMYFAYPVYSRDWWAQNQRGVIEYVTKNKQNYKTVYIHGGADWAVMYAFYNNISPDLFQKAYINQIKIGKNSTIKLENIYIGDIVRNNEKISLTPEFIPSSLIIVPGDYFKNENASKSFHSVDGVHVELKAYSLRK